MEGARLPKFSIDARVGCARKKLAQNPVLSADASPPRTNTVRKISGSTENNDTKFPKFPP